MAENALKDAGLREKLFALHLVKGNVAQLEGARREGGVVHCSRCRCDV